MFSILVVAPLRYSRQATVQHIEKTLPSNVPHQITSKDNLEDCEAMLSGESPVVFSHVVLVLKDVHEIIALTDRILSTLAHSSTTIVIITDLAQKRKIIEQAQERNHKSLESENRVLFVFKPLKPSRFAIIFDPQKGREMSTDRNQDSAQQVAYNQKQVFAELSARLGKKDKRVLLVEDNRVNQMVILKFFSKVGIPVETVMDGVQCTEKVFAKPHGYFSLILVSRVHHHKIPNYLSLTESSHSAISTCQTKTATKRAKSCADGKSAPSSPTNPSSRSPPMSSATSTRSASTPASTATSPSPLISKSSAQCSCRSWTRPIRLSRMLL
jgi:CheY-like chemotaxis protein